MKEFFGRIFKRVFLGGLFWEEFFGRNYFFILMFVKILVFVKILSKSRERKEGRKERRKEDKI